MSTGAPTASSAESFVNPYSRAMPVAKPDPRDGGLFVQIGLPIAVLALLTALMPAIVVAMALKVADVAGSTGAAAGTLSLILAVGAFAAMIVNPIAGRLSDRTRGRFGMRRPWIIGGAVVGFLALVLIAYSTNTALLVIGWALAQAGYNAALAALMAMLPDHVPTSRRGLIAAAIGVAQNVSVVAATFLVQLFTATAQQFIVPGAIGSALVIIFALLAKDRVLTERPREPLGFVQLLGSFVFNPRKHPDLGWAWLTRFLMTAAQATALTYLTYFLIDRIGMSAAEAATGVFQATLANVVGLLLTSFVAGWLSDRLGRRKIFVGIAGLVGVAGLATVAFSSDFSMVLLGEFIMGVGIGTFYAVDLALITDVLPSDSDNGKDLGVVNIAQALPQSLVPVAAPGIIALTGGYAGLFLTGAAVGLVGVAAVTRVKSVK
jgi:MFS family permease